jgi:hypothetical protein
MTITTKTIVVAVVAGLSLTYGLTMAILTVPSVLIPLGKSIENEQHLFEHPPHPAASEQKKERP